MYSAIAKAIALSSRLADPRLSARAVGVPMSEDAEIHAGRLKRSTDLRSEGDLIRLKRRGESLGAGYFKQQDPPVATGDGPPGAANEGGFASIPAAGSGAFALVLGVIALILLAILISCVAARKPETDAPAAHPERLVCSDGSFAKRTPGS